MAGRKSMMQELYGVWRAEMDLGQQGAMQAVSNQSIILYWGRMKWDVKAVLCTGREEKKSYL